jgi:hypothetical protein
MEDRQLVEQVRELRARGRSPKQIARALGVRPAVVAPIVRALGEQAAPSDAPVVGCWVSAGWSVGLDVPDDLAQHDEPSYGRDVSGLAGVAVARQRQHRSQVTVAGYLVDTYCLGVKDALGPITLDGSNLKSWRQRFFAAFDSIELEVPVALGRQVVWGAVAFAEGLGQSPHRDFGAVRDHLGPLHEPVAIGFGRHGMPFYVAGPYDDADHIMADLDASVGEANYHFVSPIAL